MISFKEFLQIVEGGLWANPPAQDSPGTKRKDAKDLYNHRFGGANDAMGGGMPTAGNLSAQMQQQPQKRSKKCRK